VDDAGAPERDWATLIGMPRRLPELPTGPLSLDACRELGLVDHQWRSPQLRRLTQTVRALHEPRDLVERARAFAVALPDDVAFSHATAARLWNLPLPRALENSDTLHVIRPSGRPSIQRKGCAPHSGAEWRTLDFHHGVRLTSPADTWLDLAQLDDRTMGRDDLVVVGDAVVRRRPTTDDVNAPTAGVATLADALDARARLRRRAVLREALGLVRVGVRSPMETRARLVFHDAGFPEPEVNAVVTTAGGEWLAEGDLVWREQRVVGEYQGVDHGSIKRRSADADRAGLVGEHGWTMLEIYSEDVYVSARRTRMLQRFARPLGLVEAALRLA
jgi:hypothetical protein